MKKNISFEMLKNWAPKNSVKLKKLNSAINSKQINYDVVM